MHQRKAYMHIHASRELRKKMKTKKRAVGAHKGDKVKVMRGMHKGKEAKVARIDYGKLMVYLEGITRHTARGREVPVGLQPSNLMLLALETTPERQEMYGTAATVPVPKPPAAKEKETPIEKTKAMAVQPPQQSPAPEKKETKREGKTQEAREKPKEKTRVKKNG